ncbi:hypothetical protein H9P43_008974 [Blastocladiella emersonii ATCC 22665]|nr:hypothetical protein H9P43_008974 [Blastocladiella emersonii ATCC 22665]
MKRIFIELATALVSRDLGDRKRWSMLRAWTRGRIPLDTNAFARLYTTAFDLSAINAVATLMSLKNRNGRNMYELYYSARKSGTPIKPAFDLFVKGDFPPEQVAPVLRATFYSATWRYGLDVLLTHLVKQPPSFQLAVLLDAQARFSGHPDDGDYLRDFIESLVASLPKSLGSTALSHILIDLTFLAHDAGYTSRRSRTKDDFELHLVNGIEPVRARIEALLPKRKHERDLAMARLEALNPIIGEHLLHGAPFIDSWEYFGDDVDRTTAVPDEVLQQARWWHPHAVIIGKISTHFATHIPGFQWSAELLEYPARFPICLGPALGRLPLSTTFRLRSEPYTDAEWHEIHRDVMAAYQRAWEPSDADRVSEQWERRVTSMSRDLLQALIDLEYPGITEPSADVPLDAAPLGVNGLGLHMATVVKMFAIWDTDGRHWLVDNIKTLRGHPWSMSSKCLDQILEAPWASYYRLETVAFLKLAQEKGPLCDPELCARANDWINKILNPHLVALDSADIK